MDNQLEEKGSSMTDVVSHNLYQDRTVDRRAWRTLFVDRQELIFLPGALLERERERKSVDYYDDDYDDVDIMIMMMFMNMLMMMMLVSLEKKLCYPVPFLNNSFSSFNITFMDA